jgi:hypothetical protein
VISKRYEEVEIKQRKPYCSTRLVVGENTTSTNVGIGKKRNDNWREEEGLTENKMNPASQVHIESVLIVIMIALSSKSQR